MPMWLSTTFIRANGRAGQSQFVQLRAQTSFVAVTDDRLPFNESSAMQGMNVSLALVNPRYQTFRRSCSTTRTSYELSYVDAAI